MRRAVNCGQEGVVHLLLSRGANLMTQDKQGRTALTVARHEGIREALLEATRIAC